MSGQFVFIDEVVSGIRWDAKYATWDNFTGKPVDGYLGEPRLSGRSALRSPAKCPRQGGLLGIRAAPLGWVPASHAPSNAFCAGRNSWRTAAPSGGTIRISTDRRCSQRVTLRPNRGTAAAAPLI